VGRSRSRVPVTSPVVLVSAKERQRLQELESAESTAWWRRDAAERAASGDEPGSGEDGPGLDEAAFRCWTTRAVSAIRCVMNMPGRIPPAVDMTGAYVTGSARTATR
jgi:hypothetical protein